MAKPAKPAKLRLWFKHIHQLREEKKYAEEIVTFNG